jgi:hypothetical protein
MLSGAESRNISGGAGQSGGQRAFNYNEDETRLHKSYVDRVLAMGHPKEAEKP